MRYLGSPEVPEELVDFLFLLIRASMWWDLSLVRLGCTPYPPLVVAQQVGERPADGAPGH